MDADFREQNLTSLPELPLNTPNLLCSRNQLTSLPSLPSEMTGILCSENQLTSLPTLPEKLEVIWCFNNQLTAFPSFPTGLKTVLCYDNQLTSLPPLSERLEDLYCTRNKLTVLPPLPKGLRGLMCESNQLTMLPILPHRLIVFRCGNNPYVEPFKTWVQEYDTKGGRLHILRNKVNAYWRKLPARELKNLMVTIGQRELQAQMGNPRDESEDRVQDCLPADCLSVIGEFLTGEKGSIMQQRKKLYENGNV